MTNGAGTTDGYRVLVVDDDEDIRVLIEAVIGLDPRFQLVGLAANGAEGVALAARERPAVVVLDLQMPTMDGLVALPLIRKCAPDAKVVVFSAFPDPYTLVEVVTQGADAYLDKSRVYAELVPTLLTLCSVPEAVPV